MLDEHIQKQARSRNSSNGRGRLWTNIDNITADFNNIKAEGYSYAIEAGGVVIHKQELNKVIGMPGIITDLNLNIIKKHRFYGSIS